MSTIVDIRRLKVKLLPYRPLNFRPEDQEFGLLENCVPIYQTIRCHIVGLQNYQLYRTTKYPRNRQAARSCMTLEYGVSALSFCWKLNFAKPLVNSTGAKPFYGQGPPQQLLTTSTPAASRNIAVSGTHNR